jgi:hypothetical protein
MKKHCTTFLFSIVCLLLFGCKGGDGVPNENPVPAASEKKCEGHNKHNHTDTRTYVVDKAVNQTCFQASTCAATKQDMINKATAEATTYCREFRCTGGNDACKGIFKLISSSCSMTSAKLPNGETECRETVTINGEIDCTCK